MALDRPAVFTNQGPHHGMQGNFAIVENAFHASHVVRRQQHCQDLRAHGSRTGRKAPHFQFIFLVHRQ